MSLCSLIILAAAVTAQTDAPLMTQPAPLAAVAPAAAPPTSAWFPPALPADTQPPAGSALLPPPPPPPVDAGMSIREAYDYAESRQGPLDGLWRLTAADGTPLFMMVMADSGGAPSVHATEPDNPAIEGAWRDLRRGGGYFGSGWLTSVTHVADTVEIRFYEADSAAATVVTLHIDTGGVWSGSLMEGGASRPVIMRRS